MILEDAFTVIMGELEKIPGPSKLTSTNYSIVCPFHDDTKPSCNINISHEAKVGIGVFACWSCDASGSWNKLAEKLGLRQIKEWQNFTGTSVGDRAKAERTRKSIVGTNNRSLSRLFEEVGGAVLPWPVENKWRGYSGKLLARVQAYMFDEQKRDELMLVLPVYINGRYRGGVKAFWEKPASGPSYLNTDGGWVMDYGLLGYDYMRKRKLYGCDCVVLCEGPRDWLRLAKNKIPAMGILGSKMFGERKLMLLMGLGIKKIYTLTDNDKAGYAMARLIQSVCENMIDFEELKLPRKYDEEGELIELDPDNAPQKVIDKVKAIAYENCKPPKKRKKK